jgi:hypothetical protein
MTTDRDMPRSAATTVALSHSSCGTRILRRGVFMGKVYRHTRMAVGCECMDTQGIVAASGQTAPRHVSAATNGGGTLIPHGL